MSEELTRERLKSELQLALNVCSAAADKEKFWCQKLTEQFRAFFYDKSSPENIADWLMATSKSYDQAFNYIVWKKNGKILKRTDDSNYSEAQWYEVFLELANSCEKAPEITWKPPRRGNIDTVREILGPQYVSEVLESNTHPKLYALAWTDSSLKKPLFWGYVTNTGAYLVLFPLKKFQSSSVLKSIVKEISSGKNFYWGLYEPYKRKNKVWLQKAANIPGLESMLEQCDRNLTNFAENQSIFLATSFLTPEQRIFVCAKRDFTESQQHLKAMLFAFIIVVLMTPFYSYTYNTIVRKSPDYISIRPRLALLFFFANAIPFLAMTAVAREHYQQKSDSMLKEIHTRSVDLLKDYDKRLESVYSKFENDIQQFFDHWVANLKNPVLTKEDNDLIIAAAHKAHVDSYFLISSNTALVGSFSGVNKVEESLEVKEERDEKFKKARNIKKQHSISNNDLNNSQIFNLIGKRIMNELNGVSKSSKATTKLEIMVESLLQKSFAEIAHSFVKAMGGISVWGFGKNRNLTLVKFMSLPNSELIDYMAVVLWNSKTVQEHYVKTTITNINRNLIGLKVFARLDYSEKYYPENFEPNDNIVALFRRSTERPSEEIEKVSFNGDEYLAVCFRGRHLERYKILGLYPLSHLDRLIGRQRDNLVILGLLSILLGLWLAQNLTSSFLLPLEKLQSAAMAIERRNFNHRVREIEHNEFGEIANIFNHVMIGLEELEVAKVVQESLFPENRLNAGKVKIYGKSITMAELGGDYLDYFEIDESSIGVLLGDVAGHGVGAALIMAMAKSGILSSTELLKEPKQLLERLHELIYSSKTKKQKKIMTFQYLSIDKETGTARYANAGGCSPMLVSLNGESVKEIALPGPALGAFKKANFVETSLEFKSGDAMIFYTDGIIEARSPAGYELGYSNFKKLVQKSWDRDPEVIYQRLLQHYLKHIGGNNAEDDLTIIIVSRE
ncbi:MAG: hypothetical protein Kow0029_19620 [Candidatus Rifleibacteriota bacterium]